MLSHFLIEQIRKNFPHEPTTDQAEALEKLSAFMMNPDADSLFLLKGYAGTGKSSLVGALVKTLTALEQKTVLLAPTGRAAKVFSNYSGHAAFTIHKKIYRQKKFSHENVGFELNVNLHKHTLFIVDEASMISNGSYDKAMFGSGHLLDDLIEYIYTGEGCRLLLMGDSAQLPPVGESISPAFDMNVLKAFGLNVETFTLTQVIRQQLTSGILKNATDIRTLITEEKAGLYPKIRIKNYPDIIRLRGDELIEAVSSAYNRSGIEETTVISRSNKRANIYNNGIRNSILYREEELSGGDMLMVVKNNYYWSEEYAEIDFIANGDIAKVNRVRRYEEMYGFRFADVNMTLLDYDIDIDVKILLDTLHSETASLSQEQTGKLFYAILEDYEDIPGKAGKIRKIKQNPHYNCLQVKYGYALTCHKAQGGQWKNVFLDMGYLSNEHLGIDFYRWLYTAFTRATEKLYLINLSEEMIEE
ncbi:MAG: AAA family ATPase [Candidatus Azobacteroides sp.]|nr:AAA family ATPase [Candidatus Azobacteroides sp.]